ncbi:hypothetical protein BH11ARM1_BH11ARM1_02510 [soil metagenome]
MIALTLLLCTTRPAIFAVGDGQTYSRIEDALRAAHEGDTIDVYPIIGGYSKTALLIKTPGLTIEGVGKHQVLIRGDDFDYSGSGQVPRAIFQVAADRVTIKNFDLARAHNQSYNAAGIRIDAASNVTVKDCDIRGNDMGVMSNGIKGNPHAAENLLFENCDVHENGNEKDAGYNHNFYLGGTSATISNCRISNALTGHNVKSRLHYLLIKECLIDGAENREIDLVDSWDTERPNSNVVIQKTFIKKSSSQKGNHEVVHFGQEKASVKARSICLETSFKPHTPPRLSTCHRPPP